MEKKPNNIERVAIGVTRWIGSPLSIFLHSILFASTVALLIAHVWSFDVVILIFNTAVSIEAIYLALFIQMTVNFQSETIEEVSEDIEEIQEDVGELQEDVEDISEDVEEMSEEDASEEAEDEAREAQQAKTLTDIQADLRKLMTDIDKLQKGAPQQ